MADIDDRRPIGHLATFAALVLFVFSLVLLGTGHLAGGGVSFLLGLVAALGWTASRLRSLPWALPMARVTSLAVALLGLGSLLGWMTELLFWNLLVPLLFFLLWPVKWATVLSVVFILGVVILGNLTAGPLGMLRHQLIPVLLLTSMLTALFVYLREVKAQQLAPLRRTDALTQASTQEHLHADLHKEIQRSEREGTALAVVRLGLDASEDALPTADRDALLRHLGRLLHSHLRAFDSYYRINDSGFLLILPSTPTSKAVSQAESIRAATAQTMRSMDVELSVSAGVIGLNVGDDAQTLIRYAEESLDRAQSRGGNRTQSWTESLDNATWTNGGEV